MQSSRLESPGTNRLSSSPTARYQRSPLVVVMVAVAIGMILDRYGLPSVASLFSTGDFSFVDSVFPTGFSSGGFWWLLGIVSLIAWGAFSRGVLPKRERIQRRLAVASLLISLAAVGAAWHHARWDLFSGDDLSLFSQPHGGPVCVEAVAISATKTKQAPSENPMRSIPRGESTQVTLRMVRVRDQQNWIAASGRATLLVDGHLVGIERGDVVRVFAKLRRPSPATNPGGFDEASYRRADRELSSLSTSYPDCVTVIEKQTEGGVWRMFDRLRQGADRIIQRRLSSENAPLASTILLGQRGQLSRERRERFTTTGTAHMLVVSGLHIGILALGVFVALRVGFLRRSTALILVVLCVVFYAMLAEARPPVLRAALLISLACLAQYLGRRTIQINALAAAALVLVAINPADLFRLGPQLSFLAVGVLIWWYPRLERKQSSDPLVMLIAKTRPWPLRALSSLGDWTRQLTLASASVWLVAAPIILSQFNLVTPLAPLLNAALWIPLAVALLSGIVMLAFHWVLPPLANLAAGACDGALSLMQSMVDHTSDWSGSHFWAPGPPAWWVVGFYLGLIFVVIAPRIRPRRSWTYSLLAVWVAIGFLTPVVRSQTEDSLRCTFLSMGHGSAVLLETPDGKTILYDGGSLGSPEFAAESVADVLWEHGIRRIDGVVLSHADVDHYNALPGLLKRFPVKTVFVSPTMFEPLGVSESQSAPQELKRVLEENQIPIQVIFAGDRLALGARETQPEQAPEEQGRGVELSVLHPLQWGVFENDNASSLVLQIDFAGRRILLPGDLEGRGLEDVMAESPIDCDIVMAPHHGSARSDPPGFATWSTPDWVVVSGDYRKSVKEVAAAYEQVGAEVLHTAERGAIEFVISPDAGKNSGRGRSAGKIRVRTAIGQAH